MSLAELLAEIISQKDYATEEAMHAKLGQPVYIMQHPTVPEVSLRWFRARTPEEGDGPTMTTGYIAFIHHTERGYECDQATSLPDRTLRALAAHLAVLTPEPESIPAN